jgi:hypothetical protein
MKYIEINSMSEESYNEIINILKKNLVHNCNVELTKFEGSIDLGTGEHISIRRCPECNTIVLYE